MNKKWNIGWGPVSLCNMNCEFCYSRMARQEEYDLSLEQWKTFIAQNHKAINTINYGTSENSISDDWFELIRFVSQYNIPQALTTNGYISERINKNKKFEDIFNNAISEVDVSLDFGKKDRHNSWRGQPKAYDWAINTLDYCSQKNINTTLVFIGTNETLQIDNLESLFQIAKKFNAKLRMNIFRPTMKDENVVKQFIAGYKEIISALEYINSNHKILQICDPLFHSILTESNDKIVDPSGINSLRILSNGDITPSTYLITNDFKLNNIKNENVLENIPEIKFQYILPDVCKKCCYCDSCHGGVFDRRYLWYGSFNQVDPYCPYREGNFIPTFKVKIDKDNDFSSIHDGYLPTMFFQY